MSKEEKIKELKKEMEDLWRFMKKIMIDLNIKPIIKGEEK